MKNLNTVLTAQRHGGPEVLEILSQPIPQPSAGEVLIKVQAAGINPIDARRMTGEFGQVLPQHFGTEFAGIVQKVGEGVSSWRAGDEVLGSGVGFTHARYILVPAANLVAKPASLSWEVAGSLAGASQTASTILRELALTAPASLLIHGGAGGVGSITIQLARQKGLNVVATASASNQAYLQELGASAVEYGTGLIDRLKALHPQPFDAAVDMAGTAEAIDASLLLVKADGPIGTIAGKPVRSARVQPMWVKRNPADLWRVVQSVAEGSLRWDVSRTYPFSEARVAYKDILEGHTRGKSVLVFDDGDESAAV